MDGGYAWIWVCAHCQLDLNVAKQFPDAFLNKNRILLKIKESLIIQHIQHKEKQKDDIPFSVYKFMDRKATFNFLEWAVSWNKGIFVRREEDEEELLYIV